MARPAPKCVLTELAKVEGDRDRSRGLKKADVIPVFAEQAKVVLSGEIKKAVTLKGVGGDQGRAGGDRSGRRQAGRVSRRR